MSQISATLVTHNEARSIARALRSLSVADEVVVDYALRMKRDFDGSRLWINAYSNDVSNYVAARFIGYTDAGIEPRGIQASYENPWKDTYEPPKLPPAPGEPPAGEKTP
jgi:hypothetical protein